MRGITLALLIGVVWFALAEIGSTEVKITGGGQYKDRKGIHVRAFSTFPSLVRLTDGTLLCYDMASKDGGWTWSRYQKFGFPLSNATRPRRGSITTLKDGTVLLVGRYTRKHERDSDVYVAEIYRSRNHFAGYTGPKRALIHIPNVAAGTDEYGMPVAGPFFEQSIVELPDRDLLACMWGWFKSDQSPSGYPDRWEKWQLKKSRVLLIRSKDRGDTWHYVATIAADPDVGLEGFRLPSLGLLPDGNLLCLNAQRRRCKAIVVEPVVRELSAMGESREDRCPGPLRSVIGSFRRETPAGLRKSAARHEQQRWRQNLG